MSIVAIVSTANLQAANAALQSAGYGPRNFSVASYVGTNAHFASLHAWGPPAFIAAIKAQAGVVWQEGSGDPITRTQALIAAQGAQWGNQAPPLPTTGNAIAGTLYSYTVGSVTTLWNTIQTFDRSTFPLPPSNYPALIRQARIPGTANPWEQPLDHFDAYKLVNPFTGVGDLCTHNGSTWQVIQADGSGNNIWEPGVFGWGVKP